jgi:pyrroloquinoline quinone (PQQ) biosynthesis protein C
MTFYERLIVETGTEREHFLSVPILGRAADTGVSRETYLAFLGEAYHHVKHTCPLLNLALQNTEPGDVVYRVGLADYIAEETGHEEWILDDIGALGGDPATVRVGAPGIACRAMVGYVTYAIEHVSPYAMLGMVHVLEGISAQIAGKAAAAIARAINADMTAGFSYLVSHGELDQDHVSGFEELVNKLRNTEAENAIVETANVVYRLYGEIFRELGRQEEFSNVA